MKSDLPNSSQFSPVQTPLPRLLLLVREFQPDRQAVSQAILREFFPGRAAQTAWDWKLADNTVIAMSQYGLVNKPRSDQGHVSLTELGESLADLAASGDHAALYDRFAQHILLNRRGLDVLACIRDVIASGQVPTKAILVKELGRRGIYHPPNGTHLNGMRQWFEAAGLVAKDRWTIDEERLRAILGIDSATLESYADLTPEQRDFARAFARLNVDEAWSNDVADYATGLFGTEFPEGGLPQSVLFALRDAGLIECERISGRHGRRSSVRATRRLRAPQTVFILDSLAKPAEPQPGEWSVESCRRMLEALTSDTERAKLATLESFVLQVARLRELRPIVKRTLRTSSGERWTSYRMASPLRPEDRWEISCKPTRQVVVDDVAIGLGLALEGRAKHLLIVTTGSLAMAAERFRAMATPRNPILISVIDGRFIASLLSSLDPVAELRALLHGLTTWQPPQAWLPSRTG